MGIQFSDLCGCCSGISVKTPQAGYQRPGLPVITARAGDYWAFKDTMTARLTSVEYGNLSDLRTRDPEVDFSIALIDAWAVTGEILGFYYDRLLSETLLPTAGELWSLHQLAGLVSYRPHPGVSAETMLAFSMSTTEGAPRKATLPSGIKVQSTPGPDEKPVIFETSESVEARPAWNAMRPRLTSVQTLSTTTKRLFLDGTATGLTPGDAIFYFADDTTPVFAIIRRVELRPANLAEDPDSRDLTRLTIDVQGGTPENQSATAPAAPTAPTFPPDIVPYLGTTVTAGELTELLEDAELEEEDLFDPLIGAPETPKRIIVFRDSAGVFGNTAPKISALPPTMTGDVPTYGTDNGNIIITGTTPAPYKGVTADQWADGDLTVLENSANAVHLDRVVKDIAADSYALLQDGSIWAVYEIDAVSELSLSEFAITGKATRLEMDTDTGFDSFTTRGTTVYANSEWIDLPRAPQNDPLTSGQMQIALDTWAPGLQSEQSLFLTGTYADDLDAPVTRLVEIAEVEHQLFAGGSTRITLKAGLLEDLDRGALRINGNVAAANHGETTEEILGSGDPTQPFLQALAKQKPLTHVTATVPGGALAEAEVRVSGVLWKPVRDLLDAKPGDRVYTLTVDPDGVATFGFGNGAMGAMPPSGTDNITATYRTGLGLAGRVKAGQLSILMTRPLGLEEVTNPLPSEGGADPETLDNLRDNVPLSCRTIDRVVSLSDFADYARAFAGIAKSRAEWVEFPGAVKPGVVVTIADEKGQEVPDTSKLYKDLLAALTDDGIPFTHFRLRSFRPRYFRMAAKIKALEDYIEEDVIEDVEAALRKAYAFEARNFAAHVFASEVITTMQNVEGVEAVTLDYLYRGSTAERNEALSADRASPTQGAELLMLHPEPLDYLEKMT
ncbi:putative baseplate assembly protein [Marimonas sp. MJW-29]|uniref:Baseplate assembly protein n=1 Tax=Sulfitobacter sediminis TaxID=3234186 RepID=A0ABV3RMJ0_9RHOB